MLKSNRTYYVCPRCDYQSFNKYDMKRHFERKRPCANKNSIYLDDSIKETVLNEFVYTVQTPKVNENDSNKHYHHYNMVVGLLNNMESLDKLNLLTDYKKESVCDFEDHLEKKFDYVVKRLDSDAPLFAYLLTFDDIFNIVNNCTSLEPGEYQNFNIFFDKFINRLKMFRGSSWESYLEDCGVKQVVSLIKSYYLDSYEIYLIRNLHKHESNNINRFQLKDHLLIYYKFLAIFDLDPKILQMTDTEVLSYKPKEHREDFLSSTYSQLYLDTKNDLKSTEISQIKKKILSIIKDNTSSNTRNLDKTILELLKIDLSFRNELLKTRQLA